MSTKGPRYRQSDRVYVRDTSEQNQHRPSVGTTRLRQHRWDKDNVCIRCQLRRESRGFRAWAYYHLGGTVFHEAGSCIIEEDLTDA